MNPAIKQFIRLFLWTGIIYGSLIALLSGFERSLGQYVAQAAAYGLMMASIIIALQRYYLRKHGEEFSDGDVASAAGVSRRATLHLHLPPHQLYAALKADPALNDFKIRQTEDAITLTTGPSWRSWGEKISVKLADVEEEGYNYAVSSKPRFPTTLVDYGKNKQNVDQVETALRRAEAGYTAEREGQDGEKELREALDLKQLMREKRS